MLQEVFLTDGFLVLVMEYAAGGDLFKTVCDQRGLSEDDARWFFQQIMFAIDYCHKMVGTPDRLAAQAPLPGGGVGGEC